MLNALLYASHTMCVWIIILFFFRFAFAHFCFSFSFWFLVFVGTLMINARLGLKQQTNYFLFNHRYNYI